MVSDADSKEERVLSEIELLEIHDQVPNKIQDYRQFGPNVAEHPHTWLITSNGKRKS